MTATITKANQKSAFWYSNPLVIFQVNWLSLLDACVLLLSGRRCFPSELLHLKKWCFTGPCCRSSGFLGCRGFDLMVVRWHPFPSSVSITVCYCFQFSFVLVLYVILQEFDAHVPFAPSLSIVLVPRISHIVLFPIWVAVPLFLGAQPIIFICTRLIFHFWSTRPLSSNLDQDRSILICTYSWFDRYLTSHFCLPRPWQPTSASTGAYLQLAPSLLSAASLICFSFRSYSNVFNLGS